MIISAFVYTRNNNIDYNERNLLIYHIILHDIQGHIIIRTEITVNVWDLIHRFDATI